MVGIGGQQHAELSRLLDLHNVPGLAMAVIRNGKADRIICAGSCGGRSNQPVSDRTRFQAASLSKPVFAYVVLQLIAAGDFSLDQPLAQIMPDYDIARDFITSQITARHVLSHTSGLPNWRNSRQPLKSHFFPGSRFSYSGEGFVYLQKAVEAVTGKTTEALARQLIFLPLGMTQSSFIRPADFLQGDARPYTVNGILHDRSPTSEANTAHSLLTTASDYARFVVAALNNDRLAPYLSEEWMAAASQVPAGQIENLDETPALCDPAVGWGLGWGVETRAGRVFHWGANPGFKNFVLMSPEDGNAIVALTNGDSGFSVISQILNNFMPGDHPALRWLGYI